LVAHVEVILCIIWARPAGVGVCCWGDVVTRFFLRITYIQSSTFTVGLGLFKIGVLTLIKSALAHGEQLLPGVHAVGLMIIKVSGKAVLASVGRPL